MTTPTPHPRSAHDPVYALVADVADAPGSCMVVQLLQERDGGWSVQPLKPAVRVPTEVLKAHILTRSYDLHQLTGVKALLDRAWADSGDALQTHNTQIEAVRTQYAGQTSYDLEGIIKTLEERARLTRIETWRYFARHIGAFPLAPPMPA